MATTTTRRPISRQPTKLSKSHSVTTPDQLANDLATKLTIGKKKDEAELKASSMRAVNEASQALTGVVQSGWKKSSNPGSAKTTLATANSAAAKAAKHLSELRRILPGDLDIERAASSVLGKLVSLEMFDQAKSALPDMQRRICNILNVSADPSSLLSIPEPPSPPTNPILLNLVSVYLLYALIIMSQSDGAVQDLSTTLNSTKTRSLLSWLPSLSSLPAKHTDSLLTRAYTAINALCSSASSSSLRSKSITSPESIFTLRIYALRCLAHTTPGTIDANTFWNQATRHTGIFVKATPPKGEEQTTSMILHAFDELVQLAEQRTDRDVFLALEEKGKGFLGFCEHWTSFANRAGDISLLKKINDYMKQPSSSSPPPSRTQTPSSDKKNLEKEVILEGTKACSLFSQALLVLENPDAQEYLLDCLRNCTEVLQASETMDIMLQPGLKMLEVQEREQQAALRICGKVDRALEKLRRSAVKYIEGHPVLSTGPASGSSTVDDSLRSLLTQAVNCFHSVLTSADLTAAATRDLLTRSIDTLFVMSKTKLNVNEPSSFVVAFDTLSRAVVILDTVQQDRFPITPSSQSVDVANYMRCISGAFYNIAGSLYQANRYGNAVPFFVESCELGAKALRLPRPVQDPPNETREKEWLLLEEQLFRRWEILGVCYSKNGDRKNAYNAFKQSIHSFPFHSSGLASQCDQLPPESCFDSSASPAVKQLVSLIDRVSYMGACDLLLPAEEISLLTAINCAPTPQTSHGAHPTILEPNVTGALLERQLDSLEPSRWKEGVRAVSIKLIQDALTEYSNQKGDPKNSMPVRCARVLIRCLELLYREPTDSLCAALGFGSVEEIGDKIESLLNNITLGKDVHLAHYVSQYRIAGHLWMALHAHRRADPLQITIISQHTDDACKYMKELLSHGSEGVMPKASRAPLSPKAIKKAASPKVVGRIVSPKQTRATRQRVPAAPRKAAPTKAKPALNPVTPKPRTRTAMQPVSFAVSQTPPRRSVDGLASPSQSTLAFDNFSKFVALLQMTSSILGSLSLILPKARLLDLTRKLAQRSVGPTSDEYIISTLDLAHEYVILGKTKRASSIFYPALEVVRSGKVSDDVAVRFLLRFAESLAIIEDIPQSSAVYLEALAISNRMNIEQKTGSTQQRVYARAKVLEIAATACHVYSLIQYNLGDNYASIEGLLQSLRLWNRAVEALSRLNPSRAEKDSDPFEMAALKDALPNNSDSSTPAPNNTPSKNSGERRHFADGLEWRISEGLLSTMFALTQAYFLRGSAREAEYFAKQAADLAKQMNAPSMMSRALTRQGEVQLHMGHLEEARANLTSASELLADLPGLETVEIGRLKAECQMRSSAEEGMEGGEEGAQELYNQTVAMLEELDSAFRQFDNLAIGPRRSIGMSPGGKARTDVLAPELLASLLSQQLWLLRDNVDETFNALLEKLISLSYSIRNKAEESSLMGKLTLHGVYDRFRNDMFLSSLTESTIAVPMGMGCKEDASSSVAQPADVVDALADAEKFFWEHLSITASNGSIIKIRDAAISLALVGAFRTSLGDKRTNVSTIMASLLDISVALTLRRDMLEVVPHKFPPSQFIDDLQWPLLSDDGTSIPRLPSSSSKFSLAPESDSESDDDIDTPRVKDAVVKAYWDSVHAKYKPRALQVSQPSTPETSQLPSNWAVINITVTSDKGTLFISRQDGGSEAKEPLIFCIPLKGRRDHGDGEDENHLTFDGALQELQDIVRASDECTKSAVNIKADDDEARSNWWKTRGQLDVRMRELLENIEYCWLGAFKTILSPRSELSPEQVSELRGHFEKVFYRSLHVKDKKPKPKSRSAHKKSASQPQTNSPNEFSLDDAIIKCFSTLSPKSRDEELEDFVYFVLDLYQFHGVPVAIAEVDIDQLVIDIRTVLEEHWAKTNKYTKSSTRPAKSQDEHLFLVLDKNVQGLPWESIPILRGRSVSRIPGIQFLHDRLEFAKLKREAAGQTYEPQTGAFVDGKKGYYVLNPSGDLGKTEERFRDWAKDMKAAGWDGVIGKSVSEQQFVNALKTQDIVVYFGHGGGEQYIRSHKIRGLPTCAATMLWGCSSGALRDMGDFDRIGTPYNYMLAGCPTLVANLWDVTDKDIDKLCQSVFDKMGLTGKDLNQRATKSTTSIVAAVAQSRDSCKLKYLTGAAPVVYGVPFYL